MADLQISGKVLFITGASSGIGLELAKQASAAGAKVAMFARRLPPMAALEKSFNDNAGCRSIAAYSCDVTEKEQVLQAFAQAEADLGPCDILIANAGSGYPVRVTNFDSDAAIQIYKLNVFGALHAFEAVLPGMIKRRSGHIVGMSSLAAFRSYPESHTYCASKSALSAQLQGMRPELLPYNIHVTTLCPGFIKTDLTASNTVPMPFILELEIAASIMLRAIVKKKRRLAFPWQMFFLTMLSSYVPDFLIAKLTKGKSYKKGK
jgi:short-subunit dehydrogenase